MASSQPGWMIYKQQMALFHHGDALWEPGPIYSYKRIKLGDVGYTRRGRFHLLFSATRPLESCQPGVDVPEDFEPLDTGPIVFGQLRTPGYLCTSTVKETGAGLDASASTAPLPESGVSFSFELTEKQGAALVTKYPIYREDIELESTFAEYTKRYYDSWVAFARDKRHGNDIKPILVSGVDMTKDFAMIAYSNHGAHLASRITISVPVLASASASAWGTWSTQGLVHTNWGPQPHNPSSPPEVLELDSPDATQVVATPTDHNQCVFIRYYTLRRRALMFPKVIKAAGDPDDLGPGSNHDESLPELMMQPSLDPGAGFDSSGDSMTHHPSSHSELELLHNVPSEEDAFDIIAKHIFQNSEAQAALIHHGDIGQGAPGTEMSHIPAVVVDSHGVGRLAHRSHLDSSLDSFVGSFLENISSLAPPQDTVNNIMHNLHDKTNVVLFVRGDGSYIPVIAALNRDYTGLVNRDLLVLSEVGYTITIRFEWPGYPSQDFQLRTYDWTTPPKRISLSSLATEVGKIVQMFIERMQAREIAPEHAKWEVGPKGIQIEDLRIAALEQVSSGSWQPRLFYKP